MLGNDADTESETLSIISKTSGSNGATVTITGGGTGIDYQPANGFYGVDSFTYTIEDPRGASDTATATVYVITPFTWTGLGAGNDWSVGGNWCGTVTAGACDGGTAPGSGDIVVLNSMCTNCNVTIDSNINVLGIDMQSSYTGTVTQASGVTLVIGTTGWSIDGGTFTGADSSITTTGSINIQGGSFTAPTSNVDVKKSFIYASGTVNMTTSTLKFYGAGGTNPSTLTTLGAFSVYNLDLDKGYDGGPAMNITGTVSVSNNLDINFGYINTNFSGGTIEVGGDVTVNNVVQYPTVKIKMVGSSNQTYTQTGAGMIGHLELASTGGTVTLAGDIRVRGEVKYTSGVVDAGTSTLYLDGKSMNSTLDIGNMALNNLSIVKGFDGYPDAYIVGTATVNGDLLIHMYGAGDNIYNGILDVKGNVSVDGVGAQGTVQLKLSGAANQTISHNAGGFPGGDMIIDKSSGTATFLTNVSLTKVGQNLSIQNGTVDMSGYNLTLDSVLTLESGTVLTKGGGILSYGSLTNNGGTINP